MNKVLLLLLFVYQTQIAQSQYSMSLGYSYDFEKINLSHHVIKWSSKWQKNRFQFTTGLGFFQNSIKYNSYKITFEDDYIAHGSWRMETNKFDLTAAITYRYLRIPNAFDWCIINTKKFKLLAGIFIDADIKIAEKGSQYKTWQETITVSKSPTNYKKEITTVPVSQAPFNAVTMASELVAIGLNFTPRFIFQKSYIQLEFKVGFRYNNRIKDINPFSQGKPHLHYENLFGSKHPLIIGIGFAYGYSFKSKK